MTSYKTIHLLSFQFSLALNIITQTKQQLSISPLELPAPKRSPLNQSGGKHKHGEGFMDRFGRYISQKLSL